MLLFVTTPLLLTKAWHYPVSAMRDAYLAMLHALFTAHDSSATRFEQRRLRCYFILRLARTMRSVPVYVPACAFLCAHESHQGRQEAAREEKEEEEEEEEEDDHTHIV